jgi:LysM repeat protein
VINFQQVNVRVTPGYVGKPAWDAVATVPSGAILWVAAGPDVADGLTWWWVSFGPIQGWVAAFANTGTQILDPVLRGGYITGPGVPTCAIGQPHTVGYGQYLVHLSNFYGVTVTSIMRTNGLRSIDLWPGQVLCIPVPGSGVSPVESVVGEVGYWQPSAVGLGVGSGTLLMQRAEAGVQWIDWTPYTTFSYATGPAATPGVLMAGNQIEVIGEHGLPGRLLARHVVVLKPALP